uniref:hypothetical protein n=1 Tax=Cyathus pallidus TaxID=380665 RepID=UPI002551D156|nr:hypothetical protein QQP23_mgp08 [Cyathus pallidus]WEV87319.1 hypothetical protein [Cyathus pallidus]
MPNFTIIIKNFKKRIPNFFSIRSLRSKLYLWKSSNFKFKDGFDLFFSFLVFIFLMKMGLILIDFIKLVIYYSPSDWISSTNYNPNSNMQSSNPWSKFKKSSILWGWFLKL